MKSLIWAAILSGACILCMVGFTILANIYVDSKVAFESYAGYAFDCLKVIFGMIIGALTEKFHVKKEIETQQKILLQNQLESKTQKNP